MSKCTNNGTFATAPCTKQQDILAPSHIGLDLGVATLRWNDCTSWDDKSAVQMSYINKSLKNCEEPLVPINLQNFA